LVLLGAGICVITGHPIVIGEDTSNQGIADFICARIVIITALFNTASSVNADFSVKGIDPSIYPGLYVLGSYVRLDQIQGRGYILTN
jgi:hypothetical protein